MGPLTKERRRRGKRDGELKETLGIHHNKNTQDATKRTVHFSFNSLRKRRHGMIVEGILLEGMILSPI
jgi:hypothetical protein